MTALWDAVRHPSRIRWKETWYNLVTCGPDGVFITVLICGLMGVIVGYQAAVQMHKYGADAFLPALIGCSIVRELGPLMAAVVATGRSGSAFAAEIGTMKLSEELDALKTLGVSPIRFLVIPKFIAMTLMIPLLTIIGDFVGVLGGFFVGYSELNMTFEFYLNGTQIWVRPSFVFEGIAKSFVYAWIVTLIGCWRGFRTGNDAVAVGRSTTSAVVLSILMIAIADAIMAKLFTMLYGWG